MATMSTWLPEDSCFPYEQIIYDSLKKSSDGFLDFADSLGVATDAEEENALAGGGTCAVVYNVL